LQVLHLRPADAALHLHTQILRHLNALWGLGLIDDARIYLGLADLQRAYARDQPHLMAELYGQESAPHAH
jgi:hypothetical protein